LIPFFRVRTSRGIFAAYIVVMAAKVASSSLTQALCPMDNQKDETDSILPSKPTNMLICGKKGCGKSSLLLNLIMRKESPWHKAFDLIFLVSPTAKGDPKMSELIEDIGDQYYEDLDNAVLQEIIERTEAHTEHLKKTKKKRTPHYALILDDCIHAIRGKNASLLTKLATQNRHMKITNIILVQKYNTYVAPLIRSNLDCIAFFHSENQAEIDSFVKEIGTNEEKLRKLYEYATAEPYSFLFINQYSQPTRYYKRFDRIEYRTKK